MQKIMKKTLTLFFAALLCVTAAAVGGGAVTAYAADYYAPITATEGTALLGQLHDLITTTHTYYTSYADCKNPTYVRRTDPGPDGELMEFYAQAKLSSTWKSGAVGTWNREHVWCQSHSNGLWGESGGGGDLLHIRPTESRVNSARGNNKYADFSGGNAVWYRDTSNTQIAVAGYTSGGKFMPIDSAKGDVARVVMYVYTHYNIYSNVGGSTNGSGRSNYFGTLSFTDIVSATNEEAAIEMLLEWHTSDPPDALERARNDAAQEIQGNRNPFVDHPEYAQAVWGDGDVGGGDDGGGGEGGDVNPPDGTFHDLVAAIPADGSLKEQFDAIHSAVEAYGALTESERRAAAADVALLQAAIDAYNEAAAACNGVAQQMNDAALAASGVLCGGGI